MNTDLTIADGAGIITNRLRIDDREHIPATHRDLVEDFCNEAKTLQRHRSIDQSINLDRGFNFLSCLITMNRS
jgi:hypothetical protein